MSSPVLTQSPPWDLIAMALSVVPATIAIRRYGAIRSGRTFPTPLVAALVGVMTAGAAFATTDSGWRLASLTLGWGLIALALIDLATLRLPDVLTLGLAATGLLAAAILAPADLLDHAIGAAAGFLSLAAVAAVYLRLRHQHGLGLGDAKLLGAAGGWLGWRYLPVVLLVASLAGIAVVLIRSAARKDGISSALAFGPPLALAIWLAWIFALTRS